MCACVRVRVSLQATEQFASDIVREALAVAYAKSPQNRSAQPPPHPSTPHSPSSVSCNLLCAPLSKVSTQVERPLIGLQCTLFFPQEWNRVSLSLDSKRNTSCFLMVFHNYLSLHLASNRCAFPNWAAHCVTAGLRGRSRPWTSTRPSLASPPATSCPTHTWARWPKTTRPHWRATDPDVHWRSQRADSDSCGWPHKGSARCFFFCCFF